MEEMFVFLFILFLAWVSGVSGEKGKDGSEKGREPDTQATLFFHCRSFSLWYPLAFLIF